MKRKTALSTNHISIFSHYARGLSLILCSLFALACGDATVVEGVDLDIRIDAPFAGTSSLVATISPDDTPGFSEVEGAVECVKIDIANSFTAVNSVQGGNGGSFELTAVIVGETVESPMFTWSGTLEASQNQTLFSDMAVSIAAEANEALTAVYRVGNPWQLRMDVKTDDQPEQLSIRIAPRLIVNTADGGCN